MNTQHKAIVTGIVQLPIQFKKSYQGYVYSKVTVLDKNGKEIPIFFNSELANELKRVYQTNTEVKVTVDNDTRKYHENNIDQKQDKVNIVLQATDFELTVTH